MYAINLYTPERFPLGPDTLDSDDDHHHHCHHHHHHHHRRHHHHHQHHHHHLLHGAAGVKSLCIGGRGERDGQYQEEHFPPVIIICVLY